MYLILPEFLNYTGLVSPPSRSRSGKTFAKKKTTGLPGTGMPGAGTCCLVAEMISSHA